MSTTMNRIRLLVAVLGVICLSGVAQAQRGNRQQNQEFNQDPNQRQRGRGFGNFNNFNEGGGRNSRRSNNFSSIQVIEGDFSIIATKSIFLRDRRDREIPQGPVRIDPSTLPPEQLLVVTGIVFEEGGFHAYVEHLLQGGLTRLTVGNKIARGEVTEIRMDGLGYKQDGVEGEPKFIPVAYNLEGTRVASVQGERMRLQTLTAGGGGTGGEVAPSLGGQFGRDQFGGPRGGADGGGRGRGGGTVIPTVPPPPLVGDPSMSIEERMKLRRAQEGQPGAQPVVIAVPVPEPEPEPAAVEPAPPAAAGTAVDVDSLTNLTTEERMRLRRAQELGQ